MNSLARSGHAEMKEHVKKARATWAEGCCDPQRLIAVGNKVAALVHVHVRLQESAEWTEGTVGDAFTFKDGKIAEMRSFMNSDDAVAWVETP
jgi:ketosteroid isomerase-like protein